MNSGQSSPDDLEVAAVFFSTNQPHPHTLPKDLSDEVEVINHSKDSGGSKFINGSDENGQLKLHISAGNGNLKHLSKLILQGDDINYIDGTGHTALAWAATYQKKESVKLLLDNGANPTLAGPCGNSPLMHAANQGFLDICRMLLDAGADIDAINEKGASSLMYAAFNGHLPVVKLLLERGTDLTRQNEDGDTALTIAVAKGKKGVVALIQNYLRAILEGPP